MSIRKFDFVTGEYYHIYSRGNSKQKIFLNHKDYERFLKLLYVCNSTKRIDFSNDIVKRKIDALCFEKGKPIVSLGAWVLMPNHFHLYITQKTEARLPSGSAITDYMHRVLTAYSKYFNAKYHRSGSLFEGKFRSVLMETDTQAKYLFSYIHLNPIKLINSKWQEKGIKNRSKSIQFLNSYWWSSYLDYSEIIRPENKIIDRLDFLNYFETKKSFQDEIFDWVTINLNNNNNGAKNGSLASVF